MVSFRVRTLFAGMGVPLDSQKLDGVKGGSLSWDELSHFGSHFGRNAPPPPYINSVDYM